jgi:uncharacterized Zn-binding protein involved in type VI secretion|tara:strand:- start:3390 stop:3680 length:291 start_codon:yes stop_codon:yes gene_type:complete
MPGTVRLTDICTGHGCYPPRENASASPNVFANSLACHRVGDAWQPHGCAVCAPHGASQASGSPNVFVNSKALARIGDAIDCGSSNQTGSGDVITNG